MTDKETARFKVKYPKINLSKERLAAYKLSLADDADDAAIDTKLDEVNGIFPFEEIARADDRARAPKPAPAPAPAPANDPAPADDDLPADTPAYAKAMLSQFKTLADKVAALESGKTVDTRKAQLEETLKDSVDAFKNTTLKAFGRMQFKDDDEFKTYLEEIKTDSAAFVQTEANKGLGGQGKPMVPAGDTSKQASKEEANAVLNSMGIKTS